MMDRRENIAYLASLRKVNLVGYGRDARQVGGSYER